MPLDPKELRRLHEGAVRQGLFPEYHRYLHENYNEILAALEDAERLEWLARTGCFLLDVPVIPPRNWEVRDYDDNTVGRGLTPRAAIDAARLGGKE